MRVRALLFLLACLLGASAGQDQEWLKYKNDAGNFSVLMPINPEDIVNPAEGPISSSHTLRAITGGNGYMVVYVTFKSDQPVDESTFQVYRDSFMHGLPNCQSEGEKAASPDIPGYIGHWYRLSCRVENKSMIFSGNLYWGKRYAYTVMVIYEASGPEAPVRKFIDSFQVLDPGK